MRLMLLTTLWAAIVAAAIGLWSIATANPVAASAPTNNGVQSVTELTPRIVGPTTSVSATPPSAEQAEQQRSAVTPIRWVIDGEPLTVTPTVDWSLGHFEPALRIYTIYTIARATPLTEDEVVEWSGQLIWRHVIVDLCNVQLRDTDFMERQWLDFGDGYQTTEGCGREPTAMQDAFDKYGPPKYACLHVVSSFKGAAKYCGPLRDLRW